MTGGLLDNLLLRIVPPLLAFMMRVWFATCRVTIHNPEYFSQTGGEGKRVVASFWHYSIIYIFYFLRQYSATVMVSASRDGEYIARLAGEFGFSTVRGSKNNKGVVALKAILRAVREGDSGAIVADGSQGPPRIVQPGALLLASRTGVPVLPMVWSASGYYCVKSWDRTVIPKPFSRVDFFYGEPLFVPQKITAEETEEYRLLLEKRLNELYTTAWGVHNQVGH